MSISHALKALNIRGYILRGEPSSEAEFEKMFVKVTGVDSKTMQSKAVTQKILVLLGQK